MICIQRYTKLDGDEEEDEVQEEEEQTEEITQPAATQAVQATKSLQIQQPTPAAHSVADAQPLSARSFFFDNDPEDCSVQNLDAYVRNPVWNGGNIGQTWI